MVVTVVRIPLPEGMSRERHFDLAEQSAPRYQSVSGLIRKYYLFSAEEGMAGGVYLWESREAAEDCFRGAWRENIIDVYGAEPEIIFYDSPVVVDNALGKIEAVL